MSKFREERIGGQRLILGDCLEVMPALGRLDADLSLAGLLMTKSTRLIARTENPPEFFDTEEMKPRSGS